jgi:hypothetical protein
VELEAIRAQIRREECTMALTRERHGLTELTLTGGIVTALLVVLTLGGVVGGIVYLVHRTDADYRHKCEAAGGRVVQIRRDDLCVEKVTDRLLWV